MCLCSFKDTQNFCIVQFFFIFQIIALYSSGVEQQLAEIKELKEDEDLELPEDFEKMM